MQQLTWFLGIISIIQMAFLPGFIICRGFKLENYLPSKWAAYFFVSIVANYILVYSLTSFHLYTSEVLRSIVVLEAITAVCLGWNELVSKPSWKWSWGRFQSYWQTEPMAKWIAGTALFILFAYLVVVIVSQGRVFGRWDPTVSYNPWAIEWAANAFPIKTWDYPQALPCNWSLAYVLIGQLNWNLPLEFFPKAIMGLFPFFMLLMLWCKTLQQRDNACGLGLIVTGLLVADLLYAYFGLGYADIPAMAMGVAAVMVLSPHTEPHFKLRQLILGFVLCAGAAVTKQAGLWLALVYPILSYVSLLKPFKLSGMKSALSLTVSTLILVSIILSWYGLVWWGSLHQGLEWPYLTHGIYQQDSLQGRIDLIWKQTDLFFWACFLIACFACLKRSPWRLSFCLIALPIVGIWLFFFSYDNRNLSLSLPFISMMVGEGLYQVLQWSKPKKFLLYFKKLIMSVSYLEWLIVVLMSVLLMGWQTGFRASDLNTYQVRQKQKLEDPVLSQMLYEYQLNVGFKGKILTPWTFLFNGIALNNYIQPVGIQFYGPNMLPNFMQSQAEFLQVLRAYPQVRYILVDKDQQLSSAAFHQYLDTLQQSGKIKPVGAASNFILYEIVSPLQ
jgi:hypothetical protein